MDGTSRDEIDLADHRGAEIFFEAIKGFWNLKERRALDAFARDGILTVARYEEEVKSLDLWELNGEHRKALEEFKPRDIRIGCSYASLLQCDMDYDFIVVDTPQGLYPAGDGTVMAEHFVFMQRLPDIMSNDCVVAFYVNKRPYSRENTENYGRDEYAGTYNFDKWMALRAQFYGVVDGRQINEEQAVRAYQRVFASRGYYAKHVLITPCYDFADGLPPSFRCAMQLVKNNRPLKSNIAE